MNRAERRALKHGRGQPTHKELSLYQLHLLNHCRPYEPGDTTSEHFKTWDAYIRLKDGSASEDDFLRVGKTLNLAMARACEIDQELARLIEPSHDAMNRLRERYLSTNKWGFDGPGMQAVADGLQHARTIMDASSPQQMINAEKTMFRVLNKIEREQKKGATPC
ncbi:hypothetical protein INP81_07330 [Comamonas thiooxydans]|uniref:hypothetical protein n=1 Tax=Comamonas thiooxydans TaxID=363952 RepID=UPI0018A4D582|nr:hypothetical protein [Comamonas thiooxydans]QOQ83679.1 hypothetical protein INP81_07330 [Comamonas thiooxydans]